MEVVACICCVIINIIIDIVVYKYIYSKELKYSLRQLISENIKNNWHIYLEIIIQKKRFIEHNSYTKNRIGKIVNKLTMPILEMVVIIPLGGMLLFFCGNTIWKALFWMMVIIGVNIKFIKEYSQIMISGLKDIQNLLLKYSNSGLLQRNTYEREKIKFTLKQFVIFLCVMIGIIFCVWGMKRFYDWKPQLASTGFVILLVYYFISDFYKNKRNKKQLSDGIEVEELYNEQLKNAILSICKKAKITNMKIKYEFENPQINLYADCINNYVVIGYDFVVELSEKFKDNYSKVFELLISHELVHIKYRDATRKRRLINFLFGSIFCFFNLVLAVGFFKYKMYLVAIIFWLSWMIEQKIILDIRYWNQIAEIRADRKAVEYSGISYEYLVEYLQDGIETEKNFDKKTKVKGNWLWGMYKRYIEIEDHPSNYQRIKYLEKNRKWGMLDYIEHVKIIWFWVISKKGWNGR